MASRTHDGAGRGGERAAGRGARLAVPRSWLRRHQGRLVIGGLAVAVAGSSFLTLAQLRDQADCQSSFNEAFTQQLAARATAGDRERAAGDLRTDALDDVVGGFAALSARPEALPSALARSETRRLFVAYEKAAAKAKAAREAANVARAANPLPATPDC